jgi:hypothetical protein
VLWIKDGSILSAFEVENTTSIDSGINRFRELFAATPSLNILAYIVVPDKRVKEAQMKIGSLANLKEGLNKKIRILKYSDIISKSDPVIENLAIAVH